MKTKLLIPLTSFLLIGCGVGNYTLSSGKEDSAKLSFVSAKSIEIKVNIDGIEYVANTVKDKSYKSNRNIKDVSQNAIKVNPGKHKIEVYVDSAVVYSQFVFISTNEHRIVEL